MSKRKKILCISLVVLGLVVSFTSDPKVGAIFFALGLIGLFPNWGLFAKHRNKAMDDIAKGRKP
jgi:hypothetical protein